MGRKRNMTDLEKNLGNIIARFQTELIENGADAVVVISALTQNNNSKTMLNRYGNTLLCDSLLRHAYHTEAIVYIDETEIEEEDT